MGWLFVIMAIGFEVAGTLSLRMATTDIARRTRWTVAVVVGYLVAFTGLTLALDTGLALGVVYGIWAAAGVALTAVLSRILFHEPLNAIMAVGIAAIIAGVLLIELGSTAT